LYCISITTSQLYSHQNLLSHMLSSCRSQNASGHFWTRSDQMHFETCKNIQFTVRMSTKHKTSLSSHCRLVIHLWSGFHLQSFISFSLQNCCLYFKNCILTCHYVFLPFVLYEPKSRSARFCLVAACRCATGLPLRGGRG